MATHALGCSDEARDRISSEGARGRGRGREGTSHGESGPAFVIAPMDAATCELYSALRESPPATGTPLYVPADVTIPSVSDMDGYPVIIGLRVRARCCDWENRKAHPYLLMPTSSFVGTPLDAPFAADIIDADYTGELGAALISRSARPYTIKRGTPLFKLVRPGLEPTASSIVRQDHPLFGSGEGALK